MQLGCRQALSAAVVAVVLLASPAGAVTIGVSSVTGVPGQRLVVQVALASEGKEVLATENRLDFTRAAFVAARGDGEPDCAVNPAIDKGATAFRFLPLGCDPETECTSVRAFVLSFTDRDPIDDGAVLYTCMVQIANDAAAGTYPLTLTELGGSDAAGVFLR